VATGNWSSIGLGSAAGIVDNNSRRAAIRWATIRINNVNIDLQIKKENEEEEEEEGSSRTKVTHILAPYYNTNTLFLLVLSLQ